MQKNGTLEVTDGTVLKEPLQIIEQKSKTKILQTHNILCTFYGYQK